MIDRRQFLRGTGVLLGAALLPNAWAQMPSARRMICGYPPGGLCGQLADAILPILAKGSAADFQLEFIEGRNTRTATEKVKAATPDGNTVLLANSSSLTTVPSTYKDIRYDGVTDFEPLGMLGEYTFSLTVGPVVPKSVNTLKEFTEWVMNNGEFRNVGAAIYGSMAHLAIRILARDTDTPFRAQPYKGTSSMLQDLHNGTLAAAFTAPGNAIGGRHSDALRTIGVSAKGRLSYWPNVPTLIEQGSPSMDIGGWFGLFAPAATPAGTCQAIRNDLQAMVATPAFAEAQRQLLIADTEFDPQVIRARIRDEKERYGALARAYAITPLD
jgi:tripartite-type tricarboxylate transporter receptor subunit TctC